MLILMLSLSLGFLNSPQNQDMEMANNDLMGTSFQYSHKFLLLTTPPSSQLRYALPLHVFPSPKLYAHAPLPPSHAFYTIFFPNILALTNSVLALTNLASSKPNRPSLNHFDDFQTWTNYWPRCLILNQFRNCLLLNCPVQLEPCQIELELVNEARAWTELPTHL